MGTRSYIGIENADNTVSYIYCHWDGYLTGVGAALLDDYDSEQAARELIESGDHSSLGDPYTEHGEDWEYIKPGLDANIHDFFDPEDGLGGAYAYLFTDGRWIVREPGTAATKVVAEALKSES